MTPTKSYPYAVVNLLTTELLSGNSSAVFPDASEFDAAAEPYVLYFLVCDKQQK